MDRSHEVVILTGPAGTGKSTIIRELKDRGNVTVCATTRKAAMNIDGTTLDKVFGLNRNPYRLWKREWTDYLMRKANATILIDEGSMIGSSMGSLLYDTARSYKKRLIIVGDWGQTAPILDGWAFESPLFRNARLVRLTECHRQGAGAYLSALNKLRQGEVDESVINTFRSVSGKPMPPKDFAGICLFATKNRAESYNEVCLAEHRAETGVWATYVDATVTDIREQKKRDSKPLSDRDVASIIKDSNLAHRNMLAIGAKVVCTRNSDSESESEYINGTMGIIDNILFQDGKTLFQVQEEGNESHDSPISAIFIDTFDGRCVKMKRISVGVKNGADQVEYLVHGFPIQLGYALTTHKGQGMTVDNAWVDMDSITHFPAGSRHGLAYVALSRTKTLGGLQLGSWNPDAIECAEVVKPWL
jgi:ATP-dependent exoDNAse (exonuclease V) alpha subunit